MSQYETLDKLILSRLKGEPNGMPLVFLDSGEVRREVRRIAEETGRDDFRVLDGRLQSLRKAGKIRHQTKSEGNGQPGWSLSVVKP